jgi:hypothetical protein
MNVLVATADGVGEALTGHAVGPIAVVADHLWAIVDDNELWRANGDWTRVARWDGPRLTCLLPTSRGLVAGTAEAHLVELAGDTLRPIASFEAMPERAAWYTPWGGPPDVRSLAAADDSLLVNVHVGGLARRDEPDQWRALVDIDVDVHQVVVAPDGSILVATGAAGFGRSSDGGQTWRWDHDGLHGSYCRAVAVAGDDVLVSASTGPFRTRGAVYRRPLGAEGAWERTSELVDGNIDTFCLAALDDLAAFVTDDGVVWTSHDAGATWQRASDGHKEARGIVIT